VGKWGMRKGVRGKFRKRPLMYEPHAFEQAP